MIMGRYVRREPGLLESGPGSRIVRTSKLSDLARIGPRNLEPIFFKYRRVLGRNLLLRFLSCQSRSISPHQGYLCRELRFEVIQLHSLEKIVLIITEDSIIQTAFRIWISAPNASDALEIAGKAYFVASKLYFVRTCIARLGTRAKRVPANSLTSFMLNTIVRVIMQR